MHNFFAIETEAAHRMVEWERAARAESRAALAARAGSRGGRKAGPFKALANLRGLVAPWLPVAAIEPARCRVATC
jgi:hypothetical protein